VQTNAPRLRTYTSGVSSERDVQTARQAAREMCVELGGSTLVAQRVSTTVSELARNLLLYAPGVGMIEIVPLTSPRAGVLVRSTDRGPGIPALTDILAGRYQSKTGLGRGILGVKRLSDRFDITSGSSGTKVESETWL
jgi:serine/threonine-protein kinase RsbT